MTAAALALCAQISALTTLQLRSVSTAHTSDSKPGRSVPVSSTKVCSLERSIFPIDLTIYASVSRACKSKQNSYKKSFSYDRENKRETKYLLYAIEDAFISNFVSTIISHMKHWKSNSTVKLKEERGYHLFEKSFQLTVPFMNHPPSEDMYAFVITRFRSARAWTTSSRVPCL